MAYFQNKKRNLQPKRVFNLNEFNTQLIADILSKENQKITSIKSLKDTDKKNQKFDLLQITGKEVVNYNNTQKIYQRSNSQKSPKYEKQVKQIKIMLQSSPQKLRTIVDHNLQKKQRDFQLYSTGTYYNKQTRRQSSSNSNFLQTNPVQQKEKDASYYQKMILEDPLLYNKVINAYKSLKRQAVVNSEKQVRITKKRLSTVENKINQKNMQYDIKNQHQKKRIISFSIYRQMLLLVNFSNKQCLLPQKQGIYRAYIGKGNNGLLIKSILKSRPWWCIRASSDIQTCNIIWTQWKNPKIMKFLAPNQSQYKAEIIQSQNKYRKTAKVQTLRKLIPSYTYNELNKYLQVQQFNDGYTKFNKKMCDQKSLQIIPKILVPQNYYRITPVSKSTKLINHIPGCLQLHSKKLLFANMKRYYQKLQKNVFDFLPQTFLISKGVNDPQFQKFKEVWRQNQKCKDKKNKNIWICKPGENSNRGNGITVAKNLEQIKSFISSHSSNSGCRTTIIQKYMQNPFLYNKRKFDIRCYILVTTVNGIVKGYWYEEGYIRTTSRQFNLKNLDNKFVHLTNDAIQKKGDDYGKFQNFNKVSYQQFQKYLQTNFSDEKFDFQTTLIKMKMIATDLINSVGSKLNSQKKQYAFEIFGLDFMLDDKLQPVILEANSNPCIQVDGPVLGKIIPTFLQNMIRIAIDPIFPPPLSENPKNSKFSAGNTFQQNKFCLVYDSMTSQNQADKKDNYTPSIEQLEQQALFNKQMEQGGNNYD